MRRWILSRACLFFLVLPIAAISVAARAAAQAPASSSATQTAPPVNASAAAETKDVHSYQLSPEKYEKAVAYSRARYWQYFLSTAYFFLILLLLLRWKTAAKLRNWATGLSSRRVQLFLFAPAFLLLLGVLGLPNDVYGQWLSRRCDQSIQGWGSWLADWTKGQFISLLLGTVFIGILYGVIRRSRRWWFYFWLATLPIILFITFLSPYVIEPMFNKFEPLEPTHPELVASIEQLVSHAGLTIPRNRMFLMKASEKTKQVNAYVTGLGASQRVVIWDTIIAAEPGPMILHTLGHEMGHYVLGHIWSGFAFFAALSFLIFWMGFRSVHWALARWGAAWGIEGVDDWASLPALLLIVSVLFFLATPIGNAFSRHQEHEADRYGLEVIHGIVPDPGEVAARAFQVEGEIDLQDPAPPKFIEFWLYDHPAVNDRILFSRTYNPWAKGEKPKYVP